MLVMTNLTITKTEFPTIVEHLTMAGPNKT